MNAVRGGETEQLAAAINLARLSAREKVVNEGRDVTNNYIKSLREELDTHYGLANDDSAPGNFVEPPTEPRGSIIKCRKRYDYARLHDAEMHCENVQIRDTDLPDLIERAKCQEAEAKSKLCSAKAQLIAIDHMWEAKMKKQEESQAENECNKLKRKMHEIQEQLATANCVLRTKRDEASVFIPMAEQEDWAGILRGLHGDPEDGDGKRGIVYPVV
ncbi:hypothetical protein CEP54_015441 [Fusarium duplospermum]|uniref:Uncharacterized protein n=1 Tax=Fusarium duplospermum TaxID=1325734 RepID=A0A428NP69_9HYPO|nr:hypothetical protein CEP54_015441 [Fusarium duplospermum]